MYFVFEIQFNTVVGVVLVDFVVVVDADFVVVVVFIIYLSFVGGDSVLFYYQD